jgi:hypothetical protein
VGAQGVLSVKRVFELANKAHFLYFTRNQAEQSVAESSAFELRDGRPEFRPYIQESRLISSSKEQKRKNGRGERI